MIVAALRARTQTQMSSDWSTAIWLLSSASVFALLVAFANAYRFTDDLKKLNALNAKTADSVAQTIDDVKKLTAKTADSVARTVDEVAQTVAESRGMLIRGSEKPEGLHAPMLSRKVVLKTGEYWDFDKGLDETIHLELLSLPDDHHAKVTVVHPILGHDFALGREVAHEGQHLILPKSDLGVPSVSICLFMPPGETTFHFFNIWLYHANLHAKEATLIVDMVSVGRTL